MATGQLGKFVRHLRSVLVKQDGPGLVDDDLLKLYLQQREEAAFEALVRRHGPMVMGVCRRVLHNSHDAEDAFQATFLVLVRKAATLRAPGLIANWLYGVAYRTALEARKRAAKRRAKEAKVERPALQAQDTWADLRPVLDQELAQLPAKYRIVLVLCDPEGKTRKEAARHLGCPEGTVASRLASARAKLAKRLARYVVGISGSALAEMVVQNAWGYVPTSVMATTVNAASLFAAGKTVTGLISANVAALTEGVLKTMLLTKIKIATIVVVALGLACYGAGLLACAALEQSNGPRATSRPSSTSNGNAPADDRDAPRQPKVLQLDGNMAHMAWSADGKMLATVGYTVVMEEKTVNGEKKSVYAGVNSTVKFWDVAKGEVSLSLGEEKKVRVTSIAFSPDGRTLAVGAEDRATQRVEPYQVRLLDPESGALKKTIPHPGTVRAVAFSPDGKILAIGGQYLPDQLTGPFERTIRLWDLGKEKVGSEFKQKLELTQAQSEKEGYLDGLRALAFSPDGKLLASADVDHKVRLLNAQTGQLMRILDGETSVTVAIRFSPNGKMLVCGSGKPEGAAKVWDVISGKLLKTLKGDKDQVLGSVDFSPDGRLLATGGYRMRATRGAIDQVILWDTRSWEAQSVSEEAFGKGFMSAVVFSPDGRTLAIATERISGFCESTGEIKLWRLSDLLTENK
jgi:RNA polymerase sigma factor (sigma-70 family)